MEKIKRALVVIAALLLTGCVANESLNVKALRQDEYTTIQESEAIRALTDEDTCVVYIIYNAPYKVAMVPRIGSDGKPVLNPYCVEKRAQDGRRPSY